MSMKVSVVVAVYNPGQFIDRCIASMQDQSLPDDEYEVLFVDDGSTDETPARLDELAAEDRRFRVIHIPNSGWPGKPRNIGIAEARGEYVQFLDQDDWMAPEALERLYEMGRRNASDIVIGKVVSDFRGVPQGVFRRNREACTIHDAPLIDSLTPHKMFRTAFLREHGILFPEGKRRLEDQLFMVRAYFPAKTVSILGEYVCYYYARRADGGNTGSVRFEPEGYYDNLREVLDVVVANTSPGDFRNRLLRRFYRVEMLGRLAEPGYTRHDEDYRLALFRAIRNLSQEVGVPEIEEGLGAIQRLRATLLHEDRPGDAVELARRLAKLKGRSELRTVEWRSGRLHLALRAWFGTTADGGELELMRRDGRHFLNPELTEGIAAEPVEVTDELGSVKAQLTLRLDETGEEWMIKSTVSLETDEGADAGSEADRVRHAVGVTASFDPATIAGKQPLPRGTWHVMVRLTGLGIDRRMRIGARRLPTVDTSLQPALVGPGPQPLIPYFDERGALAIDADRHTRSLGLAVAAHQIMYAVENGTRVVAKLPIACGPGTGQAAAAVVVGGLDGGDAIPARLEPRGRQVWLRAELPAPAPDPAGAASVSALLDGKAGPRVPLTLDPTPRRATPRRGSRSRAGRLGGRVTSLPGRVIEAARHGDLAHRIYWRSPERVRNILRGAYRRVRRSGGT